MLAFSVLLSSLKQVCTGTLQGSPAAGCTSSASAFDDDSCSCATMRSRTPQDAANEVLDTCFDREQLAAILTE